MLRPLNLVVVLVLARKGGIGTVGSDGPITQPG